MWYLILVSVVAFVAVMWSRELRARSCREQHLRQMDQVAQWADVTGEASTVAKIIKTDFGYGCEIWALGPSEEIDMTTRSFKQGRLILPKPNASDLESFCRSHQIEITLMQIKY
jgi:hypothetical protein